MQEFASSAGVSHPPLRHGKWRGRDGPLSPRNNPVPRGLKDSGVTPGPGEAAELRLLSTCLQHPASPSCCRNHCHSQGRVVFYCDGQVLSLTFRIICFVLPCFHASNIFNLWLLKVLNQILVTETAIALRGCGYI